jgi:hypothetical protein
MSKSYERKRDNLFNNIKDKSHRLLTTKKEAVLNPIFTEEGLRDLGRDFSNAIHDMPYVWSGSASLAAIKSKLRNPKYKPSRDHFHSRQRCGEELVLLIRSCFGQGRSPTLKEVEEVLDRARQVHYVTEKENQNARPYMAKQMTHKQAYKAAGIILRHKTQDLFSKRGPKTKQWKDEMVAKYGQKS